MNRFLLLILIPIWASSASLENSIQAKPPLQAIRINQPVVIDGLLNESIWNESDGYQHFTMRDPYEGVQPSEMTIVHLAYDDEALYIGARLFDSSPDSIVTRLGRRDQRLGSDEFTFYIDPYYDKRSGYYFGINAAGTFYDGTLYNDDNRDHNWDGIWDGKVQVDEQGWCVEMRIPFSQLRFRNNDDNLWAVNCARYIERKKERDYISFTPKNENGFVSRFVDLTGLKEIKQENSLEILPYFRSKAAFTNPDAANPFNDGSKFTPGSGIDVKYRVGSNLVVDMTMNPDFGQVEVDPAVVNLSAFETYFPEKRPFFIEGESIFEFGRGGANVGGSRNTFFYSRRIGRSPQGSLPDYSYADRPENANILGAAKLTGKLGKNWNFGSVHAVTSREFAEIDYNGDRSKFEVEPQTYYGVIRALNEIDNGRKGLGFIGTLVNRQFKRKAIKSDVNAESYAFGVDGWSYLDDNDIWVLTGWLGASHIKGSRERITNVQNNSLHYFQRPDVESYSLDSTLTSMTGTAGKLLLNKRRGNIIFNSSLEFISPEFDINDLGFMRRTDEVTWDMRAGYKWTEPGRILRSTWLVSYMDYTKDFDGNVLDKGITHYGYFTFSNYYNLNYSLHFEDETMSVTATRGGPVMKSPRRWNGDIRLSSDSRRTIWVGVDYSHRDSWTNEWFHSYGMFISWKPMPNFSLSFEPDMDYESNYNQWVGVFDDPTATKTFGQRYVYASISRKEFMAGFRLNWTFSPKLSLQIFAQPLVSTGDYDDFKEFAQPASFDFSTYDDAQISYSESSNEYTIDPDGNGPAESYTFGNPDFDFKSVRGNAVLRWEYLPGSTLYLVWTQQRNDSEYMGDLEFSRSMRRIWTAKADNIFMMKLAHWFSF